MGFFEIRIEFERRLEFGSGIVLAAFFFEHLAEAPVGRGERRRAGFGVLGEIFSEERLGSWELLGFAGEQHDSAGLVVRSEIVRDIFLRVR